MSHLMMIGERFIVHVLLKGVIQELVFYYVLSLLKS